MTGAEPNPPVGMSANVKILLTDVVRDDRLRFRDTYSATLAETVERYAEAFHDYQGASSRRSSRCGSPNRTTGRRKSRTATAGSPG